MFDRQHQFILLLAVTFIFFVILTIQTVPQRKVLDSRLVETIAKNPANNPTATKIRPTVLVVTGDIMLGRSVMKEALDIQKDPFFPFINVKNFLEVADITFVNLENPIVKDCPRHEGGFKFCTNYDIARGLSKSGVDVVSLANNHTENYGQAGLSETIDYLNNENILVTGVGELVTKEVNKTVFGFLGFEYVFKPSDPKHLELVKRSNALVDVLVVGVHWGEEYKDKANNFQRNLAREFIKNGADLIVGHHPHWVQDSEIVDGVYVYYSLGNFIFDQMWSEETKKGLAVRLTFEDKEIVKEELFPTYIKIRGQPEFVSPTP